MRQQYPSAISEFGLLRSGNKSNLVSCLEALHGEPSPAVSPPVTSKVIDGAVLAYLIKPDGCKTFADYCQNKFIPHILRQFNETTTRIDVVWDRYDVPSLKDIERERRQQTHVPVRRKVTPLTPVPRSWPNFLRLSINKCELFEFLAKNLICYAEENNIKGKLYVTIGDLANCYPKGEHELDNISPCTHIEADSRLFTHAFDCVSKGHEGISIRTVDTDVVVIGVSVFHKLERLGLEQFWIHFGTGKDSRSIPLHAIAKSMGSAKASVLPVFHSLTGCDTTSYFLGIGKKTRLE